MRRFAYDMPFGATLVAADRTRFRLWAPAQRAVELVIEGGPTLPMQRSPEGWFEVETRAGAGARYRYKLDDGLVVPDPASRGQADDVHDPSVVIDPAAYRWRHGDWSGKPWPTTVLYELHAGTMGGFAGVQARLPALAELGVTAVELMPINDFPGGRNWGYDGVLPFAPDRAYGTPDELKALVDAAHGLGLMIFLDVVYNHFGPDGNYLGLYAPGFFRDDLSTPWGPAIDFRQPVVRDYFTRNALYWLMEYRFDGLRFDAVHAISDPLWLDETAAIVRRTIEPGRYVHLVLEHDGNAADHLRREFNAQWNDDAHHVLHVMLTRERDGYYADYAERPADKLARCLAEGFVYQGDPSPYRKGAPRGTPSADLPPTSFVLFLQNHDQIGNRPFGDRLTEHTDPEALRAAVALQLLCPQIPLIFMGEETGTRTPFLFFTDHHGELAKAVRDGRRREFSHFEGFQAGEKAEQIPDPNAAETFQASCPQPDPSTGTAWHDYYKRLLALRASVVTPQLAGTRAIAAAAVGPAAVVATWSLGAGRVLRLACNLGGDFCSIEPPQGDMLFESRSGAGQQAREGRLEALSTIAFLEPSR
ncbi:MAG: malto-oligosyltrehalose trehalohydrolase [Alphaproteobacteria bacterium]|nr:malto-oligosyltrehalose trehalohydrolase [Alphaproteobacteria bacterium]MBV8412621.1 malto-oligosyltrehalose trehalohydrolase [Alphaproteobacteria bacterium]